MSGTGSSNQPSVPMNPASPAMPSASLPSERNPLFPLQCGGRCVQSITGNILSHLPFSALIHGNVATQSKITPPQPTTTTNIPPLFSVPSILSSSSLASSIKSIGRSQNQGSPSSSMRSFSSSVRVDRISSSGKGGGGGGPAFVGQVFSMLDPSGNGLMAVTTHLDFSFIADRVPECVKKLFARVTKKQQNGPVFRFFMDLNDAVAYVKSVNVPTGVVGACRLDVAYEHFKGKPDMFQFVPNKEQVKAANKLLKALSRKGGKRKIHGVPVFTADNLSIAIATVDGIKWYTPYFFDKNLLDDILEASIDQHFHTLINNRHMQRRRDIIDSGFPSEVEENIDSLFEPPEVQELLDEVGHPAVPLSIISKTAEVQLLDAVDKVLLGNRWLRKATGIQPKLPYLVDSFEERSAACYGMASKSSPSQMQILHQNAGELNPVASHTESREDNHSMKQMSYQFPFMEWFSVPLSRRLQGKWRASKSPAPESSPREMMAEAPSASNPLLPKITMVGVSMGEGGQMNRANLKRTIEELTKELEQASPTSGSSSSKDPLFVANVGDYSTLTRVTPA